MKDLADLTMFIINEFGEYIEGSDNPIDTTMKIIKDLKAKNDKLKIQNEALKEEHSVNRREKHNERDNPKNKGVPRLHRKTL